MRLRCFFVIAIVCLAATATARADEACLSYDKAIAGLAGKLERRVFLGPPGYGESPSQDKQEAQGILILDAPICARRGLEPGQEEERTQREVTLVPVGGIALQPFVGKRIEVGGTLFHALTGHHHTRLLVSVSRVALRAEGNAKAIAQPERSSTYVEQVTCTGGPFGMRLPAVARCDVARSH